MASFVSLSVYFIVMLAIGLYAYRKSTSDASGYMLGGRSLGPGVTALSAGASDMSGWILMGLPGAMFLSGMSSGWIAVGLAIGAYLNYLYVAPRLRRFTEQANDAITLPDFFENRFNEPRHLLRLVSALVIILFFTLYTSSGVVAGGKLFESAFQLDYQLGMYITVSVVVLYTLLGGFLAVSLTDFVQGCIMFVALLLVPLVAFTQFDGLSDFNSHLLTANPAALNWLEGASLLGIISAMAWGLGYFGQPHIIVRFMAIRSAEELPTARRIGMSWMLVSILGAMATGLVGLAYVSKTGLSLDDAETVFIFLSQILFHPLIAGFLLAAILAAIMSTISSQLLVTSSSLTEDIFRTFFDKEASEGTRVTVGRISVMLVALVALWLAHDKNSSILSLVGNAWAGFGAAFGPLVLMSLYWSKMNWQGALAGMLSGAATVLVCIYVPVFADGSSISSVIYEIVPGFLISAASIWLVSNATGGADEKLKQQFF